VTKELRGEVKGQATVVTYIYMHIYIYIYAFCCIVMYFRFYLDLLLYIVKDESLRVDEVVRGIERDSVQCTSVNAASIHRPATRF